MNKRRIIPIFVIVFTNILGSGVIIPILPLVAEGEFGATVFQATLLLAVFFGAQFLAAPWLGRLSDRVGRRPVLIVSQIGTVISFIMFALATPLGQFFDKNIEFGISGGLLILYLARTLDGITGGNITTAQAYMSDISTEENRAQALGTISAAFGLGFIFGPALGALLAGISLTAPFIGAAIISAGSVLLTIFMLKESLPPEARVKTNAGDKQTSAYAFLRIPTIFMIFMITFVITLAFSSLQSTLALYTDRVIYPDTNDPVQVARLVGLLLTIVGIASVITQGFLIRPLVKKYGERTLVVIGQTSLLAGFIVLALATSPVLMLLIAPFIAFGSGVNQPSLQSLITRFGSRQDQGQLLGLYQSARSFALILGPIWAGYAFQQIGPRAPYAIAVPIVAISLILSIVLKRQSPS